MAKQFGLGRGLASLIPEKKEEKTSAHKEVVSESSDVLADLKGITIYEIPTAHITANPYQPRKHFDHSQLEELIASIKEHGIVQPLVVAPYDEGYQLIAGERRLRAAQFLELATVPAVVREASEQERLELSLVENVQRQDLNPMEEAVAYQRLLDEFNLTQEEVAKKVGKSRPKIANILRLLRLPLEIQKWIAGGQLTEGHAKILLEIDNPAQQLVMAKKIIRSQLTIRETARFVKTVAVKGHTQHIKDAKLKSQEKILQSYLGTKVHILDTKGKGKVVIEYYSQEELQSLIERLTGGMENKNKE